jgi:hypothetical protein
VRRIPVSVSGRTIKEAMDVNLDSATIRHTLTIPLRKQLR